MGEGDQHNKSLSDICISWQKWLFIGRIAGPSAYVLFPLSVQPNIGYKPISYMKGIGEDIDNKRYFI